ncbi:MAG TPA: ATP-binding protein [Pseudonocardia sp.]|jgi:anti-sigma regulatory factor (Ser/Thr protein kinase)|uniref:ATP-binding protein n=1 Tax=Pseudonocardia sp. TaxID=60912 RepID=UPI002B4AE732|nr:ATP-binding protein [Pseudonocardia sp.]HLU57218.1 ATP-binding protein [Pseudonocardia sp.]
MPALARRPGPLRLRLPAPSLPHRLREIRAQLATWAARLGLSDDAVDDIVLATHEALANVADHAYPDGGGEAELDAACVDGEIRVVVRDHGRWQVPREPGWRGRGLILIAGLAERVDVQRQAAGTCVAMSWRLPEPG